MRLDNWDCQVCPRPRCQASAPLAPLQDGPGIAPMSERGRPQRERITLHLGGTPVGFKLQVETEPGRQESKVVVEATDRKMLPAEEEEEGE